MTLGDLVTEDRSDSAPEVLDDDVVLAYLSAHGRR
jgi:hypothetical protein